METWTTIKITNREGETFTSSLTDDDAAMVCTGLEEPFPQKLATLYGKHGLRKTPRGKGLTDTQRFWMHKLSNMAVEFSGADEPLPLRTPGGYAIPTKPEAPTFPRIVELLVAAKSSGLKFPKIRIAVPRPKELGPDPLKLPTPQVVLSIGGPRSAFPGSINVTDGKPFRRNAWYGRVLTDGTWTPNRANDQGGFTGRLTTFVVEEVLGDLDADPAGVGKLQGALTGSCCFCGRDLETRESVGAGYGPVCAKHFGLPWGKATVRAYAEIKSEVVTKTTEEV